MFVKFLPCRHLCQQLCCDFEHPSSWTELRCLGLAVVRGDYSRTLVCSILIEIVMLLPSALPVFFLLAEAAIFFEKPSEPHGWPKGQQALASSEKVLAPGPLRDVGTNGQQHLQRAVGFVAFGDSYSAGIGTGVDGVEDDCRLGSHAHPVLIFTDLAESQGAGATAFQFLSCTGSTTGNVLSGGERSQIDSFNTSINADFAILSIGGNDLGFFRVMNACIFRFYSFYSGTCETALQYVADQIESPEFEHRLTMVIMEILDKIQWEKRPWFVVTVTGYARFFSVETDECDNCTLGVWWQGPKLKKDIRQRMNDMVVAVNDKLKRSIDAVNSRYSTPKVLFVDYDARFEGHRFCEPNVTEPAYNRTETWFFLVGGKDNNPNVTDPTPAPNSTSNKVDTGRGPILSPLSPLVDPDTCLDSAERSGDWGQLALCYMARAKRDDPSLRFAREDVMTQDSMWYVPTYYGKTFHPRSLGHEAVRDEVYRAWSSLDIAA